AAAIWTAEVLTDEARAFLAGLKPLAARDGVELFHASARDPVWEYVLSEEAARATFELTQEPVGLVGHSHVALALAVDGHALAGAGQCVGHKSPEATRC